MANDRIQISSLEAQTEAQDSDFLVIHRTGSSNNLDYKITVADFNDSSTTSAAGYAAAAASSADDAANSASAAATTASNVNSALTTAAGLVSNASGYADRAETAVIQAEEFATIASQKATLANAKATLADQSATSASNSAIAASDYKRAAEVAMAQAYQYAQAALNSDSEAYAVGKRAGVDVSSGDVAYHNNSKYYSEQAANSAQSASDALAFVDSKVQNGINTLENKTNEGIASLTSVVNTGTSTINGIVTQANTDFLTELSNGITAINSATSTVQGYKNDAQTAASNASGSATTASSKAEDSEAWAVGQRNGVDVGSSDTTYNNNSKYYAAQAQSYLTATQEAAEAAQGVENEIAAIVGIPVFSVDFTTGELIYTMDNTYEFSVNTTTGDLEWEVVV